MSEPEIVYEPSSSTAQRDRTERAVLARVAAIRAAGSSDLVLSPVPSRRRWIAAGVAAVALAAAVTFVLARRDGSRLDDLGEAPSLVVTPAGGTSRFTVGTSIVEASGDTSVEVQREADGATTLLLGRGSVDCDVTPRVGRPPFRVRASDVLVEVIGTRFMVTRTASLVRVDVTRGRVRVKSPTVERVLGAGESWESRAADSASGGIATAPPSTVAPRADVNVIEIEPTPEPPPAADVPSDSPRAPPAPSSPRAAFASAQRIEATDPAAAARAYRAIANGKDVWAALALYSLAEMQSSREPAKAWRTLDELARRFPQGANAEDAAWLRVSVAGRLGRDADARAAASAYLRQYPNGTYAKSAARLSAP